MLQKTQILQCYSLSLGEWCPAFGWIAVPSPSKSGSPRRRLLDFEGDGTVTLQTIGTYLPVDMV